MARIARKRWTGIVVATILLHTAVAPAAEAPIDLFTDASAATLYVQNVNVARTMVGTTVRVDPNLAGVIGQVRQLDVILNAIDAGDFLTAGIAPMPVSLFDYITSSTAEGAAELTFDADGSGLNAYLAFAQGIEVLILGADLAAVAPPGLGITVTLTDGNMNTASSTQTVLMAVMMTPLPLQFAFADFAGVDPANLFSIKVAITPQVAGDVRLDYIQTYGTPLDETICDDGLDNNNNGFIDCADQNCLLFPGCANQAPALSPTAMGIALGMLSLIALGGFRRLRRARTR
ncbi:MAG: hypothetical protein ACRDUX_05230 [Mycobacterium sp.]